MPNSLIDIVEDAPDKRVRGTDPWVGIVIHHTGLAGATEINTDAEWEKVFQKSSAWLMAKDPTYVSAHYIISRQGKIKQLVDPAKYIAFHAGESAFWNPEKRKWMNDCNPYFVGIEMVGDGDCYRYTDQQYNSCAKLSNWLFTNHTWMTPNCIVGHNMIAPHRKVDPGKFWNWGVFYDLFFSFRKNLIK